MFFLMDMTKQDMLKKLLGAYSHHYDIDPQPTAPFDASAIYYMRDENYLISKKHVLSALEQYEYVYFYLTDHLDLQSLEEQIALSMEAGTKRVKPHKEHMSSYITLIILADTIDPDAKLRLKKTKFRKYFRLGLHGWMEYHIAAVETSIMSFLSNPAGRDARKTLELNFRPKVK